VIRWGDNSVDWKRRWRGMAEDSAVRAWGRTDEPPFAVFGGVFPGFLDGGCFI